MDKRVIFAVAGSGKSTYIVNSLTYDKRSIIITYTNNNYKNISMRIARKFDGVWPDNVVLMTYFQFLYCFCYKPFLSDELKARGLIFRSNENKYCKQDSIEYFLTKDNYLYSNRLALLIEKRGVLGDVKKRLAKYFDEFIIDEVQDIAGRDFAFLELLMGANLNMLFVGDFYQHTFDTSRDGNYNKSLFCDFSKYMTRFSQRGVSCDTTTLIGSWRCSNEICDYITTNLGIDMHSNRISSELGHVEFVSNNDKIKKLIENSEIVKLHYQKASSFGKGHRNWGDTKGEDHYQDVCVLLNKETMRKYNSGKLCELTPSTRNKLYVAITRAHGEVFLIEEKKAI